MHNVQEEAGCLFWALVVWYVLSYRSPAEVGNPRHFRREVASPGATT